MSIDDDLDFCGREETETNSNATCCCYPVCLDTCYDIISDTDAFQVCCGTASSVISRYFLLSAFILPFTCIELSRGLLKTEAIGSKNEEFRSRRVLFIRFHEKKS